MGYWLLFSVIVSLAQLWLVPLAYYIMSKPLTWVELIGNGSLLFFATTITSKTAGEYFKKVHGSHAIATLICVAVTLLTVLTSAFVYAFVTATRMGVLSANMSPEKVTSLSDLLAGSGIVFSFAYTIYVRVYGK